VCNRQFESFNRFVSSVGWVMSMHTFLYKIRFIRISPSFHPFFALLCFSRAKQTRKRGTSRLSGLATCPRASLPKTVVRCFLLNRQSDEQKTFFLFFWCLQKTGLALIAAPRSLTFACSDLRKMRAGFLLFYACRHFVVVGTNMCAL
jgi:hypothetical protein